MSRIIKSVAVVNQQPGDSDQYLHQGAVGSDFDKTILKRRVFGTHRPDAPFRMPIPTKDGLLEEINRLRLEAADAKKEVRSAESELEKLNGEIEALEEQREALKKLEGLTVDDQARAILVDAKERATQMLESAKEEAAGEVERLKEEGYREGLRQGAAQAREDYRQEHEPETKRLEQLLITLSDMKNEQIRENETDIVKLIVSVAEKIIGRNLMETPEIVVDMLREVMEQNHREEFVKITISEDLMPVSAPVSEEIKSAIQKLGQQVGVVVDVEAEPGTLLVETPKGFTDLSVPVQLDNMTELMLAD